MSATNVGTRNAVRHSIAESASLDSSYVTMNVLAAVVASYGLLQNSTAVIIGAMIIALLLGPISGIALALVDGNNRLLAKAALAEAAGVAAALLVSLVIGKIHSDVPLTKAIISRTSPNILDLVIALASGAAGAYAVVSPRVLASLVGVAVATALLPPLCVCGLTLARGQTDMAFGGFLLFLTNLVAIQLSSSVVLWLNGLHNITTMHDSPHSLLLYHGPSALLLAVLAVVLGINFGQTLSQRRLEIKVRKVISQQLLNRPGANLADLTISQQRNRTTVYAVVRTPYSYDPRAVAAIEAKLPHTVPSIELHIRSVITKEATPQGWQNEPPDVGSQADQQAD